MRKEKENADSIFVYDDEENVPPPVQIKPRANRKVARQKPEADIFVFDDEEAQYDN